MLDVSATQGIFRRIRLVIVDRQPIVLQGLNSVLGAQQEFDVIASSSDRISCLHAIRNLTPDIALIADTLPDLTVSEILAIAKAENLPTRLVFFTESDTDHGLTAAIAAGACSAISKYASPDTMLQSLRLVAQRSVFPQQFDLSPVGKEGEGGKIEQMLELLTQRERQIARLVSEGMSNKEIAHQLNVSQGTVKVHLHNIFQKLEITNRTVLATLALLRRPSGFGMLALALLAVAIADELKAAEANGTLPNDDGIGHAGKHAEYEPWKEAILRHLIVWESAETLPLTQRAVLAKASQVTNPASPTEALHAVEQSVGSKPWKDHGPVGSGTPNLPTPLLRATNDTQVGGVPSPEHQLPRLTSNATLTQEGYGTFATLAGAFIFALNDQHLATQSHDLGQASIGSFVAAVGEKATAKLAAIINADANHTDNSALGLVSHDARLPSGIVTTGNEIVAGEGAVSQMSHGAAGDILRKPVGLVAFGHDDGFGAYSRNQPMGGNVDGNVLYHAPIDFKSTSSSVFDLASESSRINLAAFGALAWLHMTAASKSIPPHTLAWIYNAASNETIVYVNPTDRVLEIGDRVLLEIHLQGIVSIADSDFVYQPEAAAVAATLEQLEQALISATATDETVLSTDNIHAIAGTSESTLVTAGVWSVLADDDLRLEFGQTGTGLGAPTRFRTFTSDSAHAAEESAGAPDVSAHVLSVALGHGATIPAVEYLTSKSEPINADTGVLSTRQSEIVEPGFATADSAHRGNSQDASEPGSAKAVATGLAEAKSIPGNGAGNDNEHHSQASDGSPGLAKTAEPSGVDHGDSGHPTSASAPEADESVAMADSADRGNSQHASEPGSAKAVTTELAKADFIPGNGVGDGAEHHAPTASASAAVTTAEPAVVEHGNSEHDLPSTSANAPAAAAEIVESSVASGDNAGDGNSHQAPQSAAIGLEAAQPAGAAFETGGADRELVFRFDGNATPSALVAVVEPKELNNPLDPHVPPGQEADLDIIGKILPNALDEHAVDRGSEVPHHAIVPAPHDLLI